jgi:hypothetical protein
MLERKVRKSLMEIKEQKEKNLIKENLVNTRLSVLVENIKSKGNFNNLSEDKKIQLSFNVLQELAYLESTGLLSEQDLGGALKSVFGGFFGNATQTFFEPILKKFIVPLFGEGFMTNFIISYLTSRPSDVIKSMSDCKLMTKLIAESIVEGMVMSLQRQKGFDGTGYAFLRNTLGGAITNSSFATSIENGISSTICGLFSKFADNAEKVESKLKTS